jgi:diguanylate cyclase (GGDEF)-like protein
MTDLNHIREFTKELTVLYVEDEPDARGQLAAILEKFFRTVIVAVDGEDGILKYQQNGGVDLIVTDIQMPRMTGIDMVKAIKAINEEQYALIISAHNDLRFFSEAIHIGIDGFIIKPVNMEQLFETLYKAADTIRTRQENRHYQKNLEAMIKERTQQLEAKLLTDELTGLYNRKKLDEILADRKERTVLLADIDNFDHVNAAYGYRFSDGILIAAARFFKANLPAGCTLFRINGDQFVYLFETADTKRAESVASGLIPKIHDHTFGVDGIDISLTCTIGIDTGNKEETLIHAHTAVKESRRTGTGRFARYKADSRLEADQKRNLEWAKKVKLALKEERIIPYFQPIISNYTGKTEKYECLARLIDGENVISPALFIEPARQIGMLPQITRTMTQQCCRYFSSRKEPFTLNITEHDLKDGYLPEYLAQMTKRYKIAPERLTLEILENISAGGTDDALEQLRQIKAMGFQLALDDFGSETSNFSRLRNLQVDYIKIDGSYIKNLDTDANSHKIVQTITKFAALIEAKVIAEYVHSKAVERAVRDLWIDYSQGYYFSPPLREIP